ncbi:hypothetical protein [Niabella ginsengisoli]|uniref:Uncharacterized protein n=1 Tax=Niabella ginsengisoli TaxID=522298 RepID=A0ABS9SE75_9BACT|nr:hypothetical protein [Niabella ginsengisoli]MCH5596662.1 hypothetical protein [Niabella ginsengisoli]
MSQVLENKIKAIQEKLQLLVKQTTAIQKENQSLKDALAEAKLQAESASKAADALQHQLDAKSIARL